MEKYNYFEAVRNDTRICVEKYITRIDWIKNTRDQMSMKILCTLIAHHYRMQPITLEQAEKCLAHNEDLFEKALEVWELASECDDTILGHDELIRAYVYCTEHFDEEILNSYY